MQIFGYTIDAPAASLLAMLAITIYVLFAAQRRGDFDWGQALKDDNGKVSALRLAIFAAIAVSSWLLIFVSMNVIKSGQDLEQLYPFYATYLAIWSGAKVAEKALDAILAKFGVTRPQS
jgi:hypothetical protein